MSEQKKHEYKCKCISKNLTEVIKENGLSTSSRMVSEFFNEKENEEILIITDNDNSYPEKIRIVPIPKMNIVSMTLLDDILSNYKQFKYIVIDCEIIKDRSKSLIKKLENVTEKHSLRTFLLLTKKNEKVGI